METTNKNTLKISHENDLFESVRLIASLNFEIICLIDFATGWH